jgi:4-alpha-glucanotransferase
VKGRLLVGERYFDALGNERIVPLGTRERFIGALSAAGPNSFAAPTCIVRAGEPLAIDVSLPAAAWSETVLWTVRERGGDVRAGTLLAEAPVVSAETTSSGTIDTRSVVIPGPLATGEYRITLDIGSYGHAGIDLVVTPAQCFLPAAERMWGIAVQLYTLRSEHNWGVGDFGDLERVCALAGDAGASLVGINPLHASHRSDPEAASPYSPASRRFLNWLAIDVPALPEAQRPAVRAHIAAIAGELARLRATEFVDYAGVAAVKAPALRLCLAELTGARALAFDAFARAGGAPLWRFAVYEALVASFGRATAAWPEELRQPDSEAVAAFAAGAHDEVRFGMYLQWCAAEQLEAVANVAERHGVALYRDLAVGVESNAADVWSDDDYVHVATVGAPPDLLNTRGQDWGLPPPSPTAMSRNAYAGFAGLVADNMRHAGALRIDHAMSLNRLFWIPPGGRPADGAYIQYPFDDLLGVLARESSRAKCLVIGEDLGTVPDGFRERMAANNVLSYRLLLFERETKGAFLPPSAYPHLALAATGTHDLPPFPGWLVGQDIDVRLELGLIDDNDAARERAARADDIDHLRDALATAGASLDDVSEESLTLAAYRFLAQTPALVVMLQIEDAIGETRPVNVPGTFMEYPNWRRKLRVDLETIAGGSRFARFTAALREMRPRE